MVKHKRIYLKFFDVGEQDFLACEMCGNRAVDIHHIQAKGMGGSKTKDFIANLIAICRECHTRCHADKDYNRRAKDRHLMNIALFESKKKK
jgi:hypothetical protein|tara:strand:- start:3073 stop:3345 length:273 start_codon:yes stop_codon:yes gene_type:complete